MCGGGSPGGPSKKEQKEQRQFQKQQEKQRRQEYKQTRKDSRRFAEAQMEQSQMQFAAAQEAAWNQFQLQIEQQERQYEQQSRLQRRQFRKAQNAQDAALQQQLQQNELLAKRSEEAANKARGMMDVGGLDQAPTVRSNPKSRKRRKLVGATGTSQLTNPLTISLGGV
jgi:hypothetical protein